MAAKRYDKFWTRRYRARLYLHERVRLIDFVDVLLVGIAITISAMGKPSAAYILLGIYLLVTVGKLVYTIRSRETTNYAKATAIRLLNFINRELFNDSNSTRCTIFRVAPFKPNYIIPWIRFKRGGRGIKEAFDSRARFQRGEGITGQVWERPPGKLAIQIIPEIPGGDPHLLKRLYERRYKVQPETAEALSGYMASVRCIISYVCVDETDQFLNLLSLDVTTPVRLLPITAQPGSVCLEFDEGGKTVQVDTQSLWRLVTMIGTVLRSFNSGQKEGPK